MGPSSFSAFSYPWLSWLSLQPSELQRLELALLSGRPAQLEALQAPLLSGQNAALRELAMECVYPLGGMSTKIQASTATLAALPPADGLEARIWWSANSCAVSLSRDSAGWGSRASRFIPTWLA